MAERIDRRSFLARGAVTGAGIVAIGASGGILDACSSGSSSPTSTGTGSHPNGVSTAAPKTGGKLIFGVEAEEKGFDPTTGTFDTTGILYARTVFDPLAIIGADGTVQPYLAQSITPNPDYTVWTVTMRPGIVFHDGTPCDGAAVGLQLQRPQGVGPDRAGGDQHRQHRCHRPADRQGDHAHPVGAVQLLPGRRDRRADRLHRRAVHVEGHRQRHHEPGRHRTLRQRRLGAQRPLHRQQEPPLLALGLSLPRHHPVPAHPRQRPAAQQPDVQQCRHHPFVGIGGDQGPPRQFVAGLHRRHHPCGR